MPDKPARVDAPDVSAERGGRPVPPAQPPAVLPRPQRQGLQQAPRPPGFALLQSAPGADGGGDLVVAAAPPAGGAGSSPFVVAAERTLRELRETHGRTVTAAPEVGPPVLAKCIIISLAAGDGLGLAAGPHAETLATGALPGIVLNATIDTAARIGVASCGPSALAGLEQRHGKEQVRNAARRRPVTVANRGQHGRL